MFSSYSDDHDRPWAWQGSSTAVTIPMAAWGLIWKQSQSVGDQKQES